MLRKLAIVLLAGLAACQPWGYEKTENSVIVRLKQNKPADARLLKLEVLSEKIIRISATPAKKFATDTSLIINQNNLQPAHWTIEENEGSLIVKTSELSATVSLKNGAVEFADMNGNILLRETPGRGKSFTPVSINGENFYEVRQLFESPANEAFYGLGQHQDAQMNYRGLDVELYQYNTKVAVPFVISNKNYGLLWDNYSLSRFGDAREYQSLEILNTYNHEGIAGGLTALYRSASDSSKIFVRQQEQAINYEFIPDLDRIPELFPMNQGKVSWEGFIESDTSGMHKFRLYSAGYTKVWINNQLAADRWRMAWNPTTTYFAINMQAGERIPLRIEWNPDGGQSYIGLRCLKPQHNNDQQRLSLFSEVAKQIDYYFIKGSNMDDVISGYRNLTGKAPMMPKWAMGFWQSRERYKTQNELLEVVAEYRKRNIPFDNIVLDWFYWPENRWGDHNFDTTRFPNARAMVHEVHNKFNAQIMISVWPKFYEETENYKKFNEKGWVYKKNIADKRLDWVGKGYVSTFYDPFNAGARNLFWELLNEKLFSKGIDAWWMDASEPDIHSNMPVADRKALMDPTAAGPAAQFFNAFPLMNAKGIYEGQKATNPNQRVFILTRSAFAGQQRYAAATWSGDVCSRWEEMYRQISAGLNFNLSGLPYWTMDIGGFAVERRYENQEPQHLEEWRELQTRWYQFGAFVPFYRAHGQFPYREIFNIAPETHAAYQSMVKYTKLRYRLMPYIYSLAGMVHHSGYTIMRALPMDFANDDRVSNIADQYMFGPAILVNPVTQFRARQREVYLPAGIGWYEFQSGKYFAGGQTITANAPYTEMPLFVKAGAIIPLGPDIQFAMQKTDQPIAIFVFTGYNGSFTLYEDEGTNYNYENGHYSTIPLTYNEENNTLYIGDRSGSFAGMEENRRFKIVWIKKGGNIDLNAPGTEVKYTGKAIQVKM